ncbi:hypothetical protein CEXT_764761 [Caerostris extrusa]|uniref:Uncharacterized protein n=1 Tax=Caerostris extrusa TaxID=172846 RepID=A0AAV4VFE9_CAEEX|nr:hypothetical protein CEXT_764761 [Caerostris extrusa]
MNHSVHTDDAINRSVHMGDVMNRSVHMVDGDIVDIDGNEFVTLYSEEDILVSQHYVVEVYDEFVPPGSTAVLRCHIPGFMEEYVNVMAWKEEPTGKNYTVFCFFRRFIEILWPFQPFRGHLKGKCLYGIYMQIMRTPWVSDTPNDV